MKNKFVLSRLFLTSIITPLMIVQPVGAASPALAARIAADPESVSPQLGFLEQSASDKVNAQEERLYSAATADLNNGDYSQAVTQFDQIAKMKGRRAEGALYWKAYALNKAGQRSEALSTIAELRRSYPQSRWLKEASALEIEINPPANPNAESDDDLKILALSSLMNSDPARAIPYLDVLLKGNASPKLKDKALFVLTQSDSDQAQQILANVAKNGQNPDLQRRAVHYLGIYRNNRNRQLLQEIYGSSGDPHVKKAVLHAFMISGDKERVLAVAKGEKDVELQKEAIHQLGIMGARNELRELYKTAAGAEAKKALLHSMFLSSDVQGLIDAAKTEIDADVRREAIHDLGITSRRGNRDEDVTDALVQLYNSNADVEDKRQLIHSLFIRGAAKGLVDLARKESNPELKKEIVHRLSIMHSKEATDYMLEILNK